MYSSSERPPGYEDVHEDSDAFAYAFKYAFGDPCDFAQFHTEYSL